MINASDNSDTPPTHNTSFRLNAGPHTKMKTSLLTLTAMLLLGLTRALGHGGVELGPDGGRILEFSKNQTLHGEVIAKDGFFHIALLDKAMKPVGLKDQELTATTGDRKKPGKLTVEKKDGKFVVPMQKGEEFLTIFQFRDSSGARQVTARLTYDAAICSACKNPEWLCKCGAGEAKKDTKHDHDKK